MKVAIIGAGAAGLATARHVSDPRVIGVDCVVYEQTGHLGGTWVYSDRIGVDEFGLPVHSSMYQGLRTNLPKEIMGFPDFPIPDNKPSYLTQEEILRFLENYANHFHLQNVIQYHHYVKNVKPISDTNKWMVNVVDVLNKREKFLEYDVVIVCNGHYYDPLIPTLNGIEDFEGRTCHSHDYRMPYTFQGKIVLIIGAGPSGLDIALQVSKFAEKIYLSHHLKDKLATKYDDNIIQKPDVKRVFTDSVEFVDGSIVNIDVIFYCTGYNYNFPFLDKECQITVNDNYIQPLYKHMINMEYPTMCFIGIPFNVCAFQMFDLQARYYVKYLLNEMELPTKECMYEDTESEMNERWQKGYTKRQAHSMGPDQSGYYNQLALTAKITPIAPVIVKLREASAKRLMDDILNFRNDVYKVIDDYTFIKVN